MEKKRVRRSFADCQQETMGLIKFALKKANSSTIPLNVARLCQEFKEETESMTSVLALQVRIGNYRSNIYKLEEFDRNTKIKLMFWLSASVNSEFLEELQKDAEIELDNRHRIIKYKSKDGTLQLEGEHKSALRMKSEMTESRKRQQHEAVRLSDIGVGGETLSSILGEEEHSKKGNESTSVQSTSYNSNQSELEAIYYKWILDRNRDAGDAEAPWNLNHYAQPVLMDEVKTEQEESTSSSAVFSNESGYAYYQSVLKYLHVMVLSLDSKSLFVVQEKIEKKIDEAKRTNQIISTKMIKWALKSFLHKVHCSATLKAQEGVESKDLKEFLILLRQTVMGLQLSALDGFQEKLEEIIKYLIVDMVVPVERIRKALETTLDVIDPN